jgi:uncharacterized LabA/DUF88 family protein
MDRYAIFVDAGYFFAAGAQAAFGAQTPKITRKQVSLKSPKATLADLCRVASATSDSMPLLRAYWYDAMPGPRMSIEQSALAMLSGVKLRLGALNSAGEQKGVDSLIVTDIIDLARNRAIADAVVVTGDEDLRIAFQVAQSFGVRVHILAAGDPTKNVSPALQMEADSVSVLDAEWFRAHIELTTPAPIPAAPAAPPVAPASAQRSDNAISPQAASPKAASLDAAAKAVFTELLSALGDEQIMQLVTHVTTTRQIPPEYDRPFIAKVSAVLGGRRLEGAEMRHIRGLFIAAAKAAQRQ